MFPEDISSESEPEEGDSTLSYIQKVTTKKHKVSKILPPSKRPKLEIAKNEDLKKLYPEEVKKYTFKKILPPSLEEAIPPSNVQIVISDDEELERSMSEIHMPSLEYDSN